ncbi:hypothetical protein [Streptomyces sp. MUM 2J]|uniref:hypothetical protein n=1 Tax=Streptomyces sp. MUM 2J TaxID=2791987 RepID=UPI001F03CA22|nr:hypothetical protein [Streptomyces sp. MUM 2J]MCH0561835.1 hypothetical protein [Streptomyces sp. MUM 2J]
MTGSTPSRKRRFPRWGADSGPSDGPHGVRDDERGSPGTSDAAGPASDTTDPAPGRTRAASLESPGGREHLPAPTQPEGGAPERSAPPARATVPAARTRAAAIRRRAGELGREGARRSGSQARAGLSYLVDRVIDIAPRVPVRDLATLRRQFPGLGPEQLADRLVAGASRATSTVGAGIGAAAMLPVPPAMPAELATEITGVAAIELKLIAELHEVYGLRPPGGLRERSTLYLRSWSGERGIDVLRPSTIDAALGGRMKRELRQQIMKRLVRDLPNLMPFMIGAGVGAVLNRRETRRLAARVRTDLRKAQVPWDVLPEQPPLEQPDRPLALGEIAGELGH